MLINQPQPSARNPPPAMNVTVEVLSVSDTNEARDSLVTRE